jgi:hypothetical protein
MLATLPDPTHGQRSFASIAGRHAKRFVNAAKVVIGEPQHDGGPVVLPFLAEAVRKSREAPKAHARA